ncbi:phosphoribosylglycinamide formyltransferase [Cytophagaceae bacterium ABcell3]|nr:phosphoribosylglycinamide formyltransferase [Cytophagaceae bacterium ABcell3]
MNIFVKDSQINIAVFCSGSGSNAQKIFEYFRDRKDVNIVATMCNKKDAYALERAKKFNIPTRVFNKEEFAHSDVIVNELKALKTDWVILAGFLWLIPDRLLEAFPGKIINIHPALLPAYGGKGMYGMYVHQAVLDAKEKQTGITVHYINENYDEGEIIFQAACDIGDCYSPEMVAKKVQSLEHQHYPRIIDELITQSIKG